MEKLAISGGEKAVKTDIKSLRTKFSQEELRYLCEKIDGDILYNLSGSGIIREFEEKFANFIGRKYAIAVNSGTMAIFSAYFSLGLEKESKILAPSYGYHASVYPMFHWSLDPLFCEIEEETLNIDISDIERKINEDTKAIVIASMWGLVPDYKRILEIANKHNLLIIDDVSRSLGGFRDGCYSGRIGDISCISLNIYKMLGVGEGGVIVTDNADFHDRMLALGQPINFNISSDYYKNYFETCMGIKSKIHPVAALLGIFQLKNFEKRLNQCNENFEYLTERLSEFDFLKLFQVQ